MPEFITNHLAFFIVILISVIMSIITMILYYVDKQKAKHNKWRIKEATLITSTLLLGGLGAFIGIFVFRHKTKHWYFLVSLFLSLVIECVILYIIY